MSTDNKKPNAELIAAYCRDWQETAEPWKRWQVEMAPGEWKPLIDHPIWSGPYEYRRKPDTVVINGIACNAPLKVAPPLGKAYWTVSADEGGICSIWDDDAIDQNRLKNGCACATEDDAEKLWNAMTAPLRAYVGGEK